MGILGKQVRRRKRVTDEPNRGKGKHRDELWSDLRPNMGGVSAGKKKGTSGKKKKPREADLGVARKRGRAPIRGVFWGSKMVCIGESGAETGGLSRRKGPVIGKRKGDKMQTIRQCAQSPHIDVTPERNKLASDWRRGTKKTPTSPQA